MRLEQIRYIVEIADTGSFTLASERLFIAQPSISQAVTALEKELNLTLFTRFRTGSVPTTAGLQVIDHARRILREITQIEKLANQELDQIHSTVNIGIIPALCTVLLPAVLADYKKIFPNVTIRIREEGSNKILADCQKGDVDVGLISLHDKRTPDREIFNNRFLFEGHLVAYVGEKSTLKRRNKISFRELLPFPLMLYGDEFSLHAYILRQISQYGTPNVLSTTHNPESIKRFVMQLDAVGFGPDISLLEDPYVKNRELFLLEIIDASPITFSLVSNRKRAHSVAVESLIREIIAQSKAFLVRGFME